MVFWPATVSQRALAMTQPNSNALELTTAQRLLPQWFLDLDAARKPYVIVGIVLIGIVPLLALAVIAAARSHRRRSMR